MAAASLRVSAEGISSNCEPQDLPPAGEINCQIGSDRAKSANRCAIIDVPRKRPTPGSKGTRHLYSVRTGNKTKTKSIEGIRDSTKQSADVYRFTKSKRLEAAQQRREKLESLILAASPLTVPPEGDRWVSPRTEKLPDPRSNGISSARKRKSVPRIDSMQRSLFALFELNRSTGT
jgi:hypothetical protein